MTPVITIILLVVFVLISVLNWIQAIQWWTIKKRSSSIPLIGGLAGCIACLISPWLIIRQYWWLPLVIDLGFMTSIIGIIKLLFLRNKKNGNSGNHSQ